MSSLHSFLCAFSLNCTVRYLEQSHSGIKKLKNRSIKQIDWSYFIYFVANFFLRQSHYVTHPGLKLMSDPHVSAFCNTRITVVRYHLQLFHLFLNVYYFILKYTTCLSFYWKTNH